MSVFAISDLHLPGGELKPMDVFGVHWGNHMEQIEADWRVRVAPLDLVLLPGDFSWAMRLDAAREDLSRIGALPGKKIILRGNHDYWWSSISQVRAVLSEGMFALQNDSILLEGVLISGARGWLCPGAGQLTDDDRKIYAREVARLELSLKDADKKRGVTKPWHIAMLHFPPFADKAQASEVTELLTRYGVSDAVYGHLHGQSLKKAFSGVLDGVRYHQVSCDGLGFTLHRLDGFREDS